MNWIRLIPTFDASKAGATPVVLGPIKEISLLGGALYDEQRGLCLARRDNRHLGRDSKLIWISEGVEYGEITVRSGVKNPWPMLPRHPLGKLA